MVEQRIQCVHSEDSSFEETFDDGNTPTDLSVTQPGTEAFAVNAEETLVPVGSSPGVLNYYNQLKVCRYALVPTTNFPWHWSTIHQPLFRFIM